VTQHRSALIAPEEDGRDRTSTVERLYGVLRAAIVEGRVLPGQRLIESALISEFGVSRPSIRAALAKLAAEGLLELVRHRGAVVRRLRRREIFDRYVIREALETLSARLAAEQMGDANVRRTFENDIAIADTSIFDVQARRDENRRFHKALATASGNGQLWGALDKVLLPIEMVQLRRTNDENPEYWDVARAEHMAIAAAVVSGDVELAGVLMRNHVRRVRDGFMLLPPSLFSTD
jgi:DNA-binding GntR family transcriptional regulator